MTAAEDAAKAAAAEVELERKNAADEKAFRETFVKISGYKASDVDTVNVRSQTAGTTNGGKYQVTKRGAVRVIKGPATPKQIKAAQSQETEE